MFIRASSNCLIVVIKSLTLVCLSIKDSMLGFIIWMRGLSSSRILCQKLLSGHSLVPTWALFRKISIFENAFLIIRGCPGLLNLERRL